MQCLYTRTTAEYGKGFDDCDFNDLPKLYGLAERLQIRYGLKDAVLDAFRQRASDRKIDDAVCESVVKHTSTGSGFRRLVAAALTY